MRRPSFRTNPLRAAARRLFLDQHAEFWLGELRATWSLRELRARVVEIIDETHDTKTFVLRVPRAWPGHRAGQYVPVEVEIGGVRVRRCYSISNATPRTISVTVRRVPGGKVSTWLHEELRPGDVVRLGKPSGDFVLAPYPATTPQKLLLVGGGSGLTPIMGIVRDLAAKDALDDVTVLHVVRGDRDALFWAELTALATRFPGLTLVAHRDDRVGYLTVGSLTELARGREVYACGPAGLLDVCAAAVPPASLHVERFLAPRITPRTADAPVQIRLSRTDRAVTAGGPGTLLDQLERAGERPAHGCRMGICNTCRCPKLAGVTEDLATGAVSDAPGEIRLCTSIARSDLTLAL